MSTQSCGRLKSALIARRDHPQLLVTVWDAEQAVKRRDDVLAPIGRHQDVDVVRSPRFRVIRKRYRTTEGMAMSCSEKARCSPRIFCGNDSPPNAGFTSLADPVSQRPRKRSQGLGRRSRRPPSLNAVCELEQAPKHASMLGGTGLSPPHDDGLIRGAVRLHQLAPRVVQTANPGSSPVGTHGRPRIP